MITRDFKKEPDYLIEVLAKTINGFFPDIGKWVGKIKDPRMINKTKYNLSVLYWTGIFLFLFKLESTRNINYCLGDEEKFFANFSALFPILGISQSELEKLPDHQTLTYLLKKLSPHELEKIGVKAVKRLIRKRVLEKFKLFGVYYLIAVDGTRMIKFKERHCDNCLSKKIGEDKDGNPVYEYYHYVLAADLVTKNRLSIPILTEFVENESAGVSKQDCELKAFYRLEKRLKEYFPKTKLCLLLDALYDVQPTFDVHKKNKWEYIINFKEKTIPTVTEEYKESLNSKENKNNRATLHVNKKIKQEFKWVNNIEYQGHKLHILECLETKIEKGEETKKKFIWISSFKVSENNYHIISNEGGRCRWKIENQKINCQKNEGYELEHAYSKDYNAMKCFYYLLQIAHNINQMIEKGDLIEDVIKKCGSKKNFYKKFWHAFIGYVIDCRIIQLVINSSFRIRLDSS